MEDAFRRFFHREPHIKQGILVTFYSVIAMSSVTLYAGKQQPCLYSKQLIIYVCNMSIYVYRALQLPVAVWYRFSVAHCSITTMTIKGDGKVKVTIGDVGHIPPQSVTY